MNLISRNVKVEILVGDDSPKLCGRDLDGKNCPFLVISLKNEKARCRLYRKKLEVIHFCHPTTFGVNIEPEANRCDACIKQFGKDWRANQRRVK
ncbi:MAG: hypothetical protein A2Y82_02585 [Candidatus Buchananbacteria bacterium RBG_13_36_9]|uniref:Uncharacterized protein n=1 Tax=Candidatus Buchananbacteria bacterium RBG_13_36_9 TaxID=1797530 RepID=A0A1G1XP68_9BACT|nr:MAG: hypothetical protein A2Y82_02585 [Candidatus Buchananbacteria bacterium RBG_13_36_9]